jgi:hypothetical protein
MPLSLLASDINSFTSIPNKIAKGFTVGYHGISVDDCAGDCVQEQTFTCQSFHYCWDSGFCALSTVHPDERPDMLRDDQGCDLYYREYRMTLQFLDEVMEVWGASSSPLSCGLR